MGELRRCVWCKHLIWSNQDLSAPGPSLQSGSMCHRLFDGAACGGALVREPGELEDAVNTAWITGGWAAVWEILAPINDGQA